MQEIGIEYLPEPERIEQVKGVIEMTTKKDKEFPNRVNLITAVQRGEGAP